MGHVRALRSEALRKRSADAPIPPASREHEGACGRPQRGEQRRLPFGASQFLRRVPASERQPQDCIPA